jgi:uncharacterized glyoxalase superfamily protein PhnB
VYIDKVKGGGMTKLDRAGLSEVPQMMAALAVDDIEQASDFYEELGFGQEMTISGPDGRLAFAFLVSGSAALLLGPLGEPHYVNEPRAEKLRKGSRGLGVTLILHVPTLQKVYDAVREARLEILLEPVDEFYGERVFMFLDPHGYEWKISQTIESVSREEVSERVASAGYTVT